MTKPRIVNKMPNFIKDVQIKSAQGMVQALILGSSQAAEFTPQQTANLINGRIRDVKNEGAKVVGTVGYTAEYALAVHEASGALKGKPRPKDGDKPQGNYWDPRGEPEFLKKGFEKAEPNIRKVLTGAIKT